MQVWRHRAGRAVVAPSLVLAALLLPACGGGSDEGADDVGTAAAADDGGSDDGGPDDGNPDDGGGDLSLGEKIPDYFPSDFYLPAGMTVRGVSRSGDMITLTGTFESGDVDAIQADMVAGLEAAGYELLSADETAAFVKNGVGRVRVRTSTFLDELTVSVDIDSWTDAQLDELRALFAEERTVTGRAVAEVGGDRYEAEGECLLKGPNRSFYANDVSITLQIDETQDPTLVYADVTTPDGTVLSTEYGADLPYESSDAQISASGEMVTLYDEAAGSVSFTITATCDA
jgi:hypothetical protein